MDPFLRIAFIALISLAPAGSLRAADAGGLAQGIIQARELSLPEKAYPYRRLGMPEELREVLGPLDNTPVTNPLTDDGATLGRVLFYDVTLSANGTTSCASCHRQSDAFAEPLAKSVGFDGKEVPRNSMSLVNLRFYRRGRFFWDERAASLEEQVLMPIENPVEMGGDLNQLEKQLSRDPIYAPLFAKAFGDPKVTRLRIARALAQFVRSIVSFDSRYDRGLRVARSPMKPFQNFTEEENLGKAQFFGRARCAECHLPGSVRVPKEQRVDGQWHVFQLDRPGNNGVDMDQADSDPGVAETTGERDDLGKFKPSTLRNLSRTAPYMHDGRFETIDQVIEHYNWSVKPHPSLDPRLEDFAANGLALPEVPKVALAKFLETLTDERLLTAPRFSNPFVDVETSSER